MANALPALVTRTKMATLGHHYVYRVYVPVDAIPPHARAYTSHVTVRGSNRYATVAQATVSPDHCGMPPGFERYDHWLAHERSTRPTVLATIVAAFPEVGPIAHTGYLSTLCSDISVAFPADIGGHAERTDTLRSLTNNPED